MTTTIRTYTRRKPDGPPCCVCGDRITPGEVYREAVTVQPEWSDERFVRDLAHDDCARGRLEWEVTEDRVRRVEREVRRARQRVETFNAACPIGTEIRVWTGVYRDGPGRVVEVRPPGAFVNSAGAAVVKVPGDCIALSHVEVTP